MRVSVRPQAAGERQESESTPERQKPAGRIRTRNSSATNSCEGGFLCGKWLRGCIILGRYPQTRLGPEAPLAGNATNVKMRLDCKVGGAGRVVATGIGLVE